MNVKIGSQNIIILFEIMRMHTAQFHLWEYINRNQAFILDPHQLYICSA
jgi:hypothetical protein